MNTEIKTNDRFNRLCNNDISTHYRDLEFWALPSEFLAAFAYWVVAQNPNKALIELNPSLIAFKSHVLSFFEDPKLPEKFTFESLQDVVNDTEFENITDILALNKLEPDFIDLGALARNVFYMILREHITQD